MLALAAMVAALAAPQHCTPRTIGPGSQLAGGTKGAACLVAAFKQCRPADYVLTGFAGKTAVIENFSVRHWKGGCAVIVIRNIAVPQQNPVVTGPRICRRVRSTASVGVVDRCGRGKPDTFPLITFE